MKGRALRYSDAELQWIETHREWPRAKAHQAFCKRFGRHDVKLTNYNSLCKRNGWLTGRTGRYEPGRTPENKGKKMPWNANSARTRFKKGQKPHNAKGPGHEMVCPKDGYVYMIVAETNPHTGADTNRVLKHKYLWEQANGPLPDGMALKCLDGNKTNTDPSNWQAIPRAMLPRLNGRFGRAYDTAPPEVKPTIMATAQLEHKLREMKGTKS